MDEKEYKAVRLSKEVTDHLQNNVINLSKWVETRYRQEFMEGK